MPHLLNVLAIYPDRIPSTEIITNPLKYLHKHKHVHLTVTLEQFVKPMEVAQADVIITCRNIEPIYQPIYEFAQQSGIPIIYNLDDDLLNIPPNLEDSDYYRQPDRQAYLKRMLANAGQVYVYSPVLQAIVEEHNSSVSLMNTAVNWSLVSPNIPCLSSDKLHIVYATSRNKQDPLFQLMVPDLHQLLQYYGHRVHLHILGFKPTDFLHYTNVTWKPFNTNYINYFRQFTRFGYAIGLAPMSTDAFYQSKTNNKFREYAAAGAAGIYQDCSLYNQTITHEHTGLIISGELGSWFAAIQRLVDTPTLLSHIRQHARAEAKQNHSVDALAQVWLDDLRLLSANASYKSVDLVKRWWFTRSKIYDTPVARALRTLYHRSVPPSWRLKLRDWRHYWLKVF